MHVLRPTNTKNDEQSLNTISYQHQYKDKFIHNNALSALKWNQITDMINKTYPHILVQLYYRNWINYKPIPFLEYYNRTAPLQKGGGGYGWFTTVEFFSQML